MPVPVAVLFGRSDKMKQSACVPCICLAPALRTFEPITRLEDPYIAQLRLFLGQVVKVLQERLPLICL